MTRKAGLLLTCTTDPNGDLTGVAPREKEGITAPDLLVGGAGTGTSGILGILGTTAITEGTTLVVGCPAGAVQATLKKVSCVRSPTRKKQRNSPKIAMNHLPTYSAAPHGLGVMHPSPLHPSPLQSHPNTQLLPGGHFKTQDTSHTTGVVPTALNTTYISGNTQFTARGRAASSVSSSDLEAVAGAHRGPIYFTDDHFPPFYAKAKKIAPIYKKRTNTCCQ